ncbi:MAG: hypothetical protein SGARI_003477, partial [Bacillariaceae sp.]
DLGVKTTQDISDATKHLMGGVKSHTEKFGGRMKVVFAAPLDVTKGYVPSHKIESKTDSEIQFLNQAFVESDEFIFKYLSVEERDKLVAATELVTVKKGIKVIQQGDLGDYLYVLKTGKVTFNVDGKDVGSSDQPGAIFGELALLYDCPRAATVTATAECQFYRVSQHTFRRIQASHALENKDLARESLRNLDMFQGLPEELIGTMADCLMRKKIKKGDVMIEKGSNLHGLCVVKEGHLKATDISIGSTKYADIRFGPGESFGEGVLLSGDPSPGTVTASTNAVVWILTKERFFRILGHLDLKQLIRQSQNAKFLVSRRRRFRVVVGISKL